MDTKRDFAFDRAEVIARWARNYAAGMIVIERDARFDAMAEWRPQLRTANGEWINAGYVGGWMDGLHNAAIVAELEKRGFTVKVYDLQPR